MSEYCASSGFPHIKNAYGSRTRRAGRGTPGAFLYSINRTNYVVDEILLPAFSPGTATLDEAVVDKFPEGLGSSLCFYPSGLGKGSSGDRIFVGRKVPKQP